MGSGDCDTLLLAGLRPPKTTRALILLVLVVMAFLFLPVYYSLPWGQSITRVMTLNYNPCQLDEQVTRKLDPYVWVSVHSQKTTDFRA